MEILKLFVPFIIYSFIGWNIEILDSIVENKKFINRGFLIGPYCPIYGVGALLIITFLDKYKGDLAALFMMSIFICSVLEYFTSFFMEKIFKTRWWDYSNKKFNINGRICLETLIPFGLFGCFLVYILNPFLYNIINLIPINILYIVSSVLIIIFIVDLIVSFSIVSKIKIKADKLRKDSTEEISKKVKSIITKKNLLYKRLVNSFPNLKNIIKINKD